MTTLREAAQAIYDELRSIFIDTDHMAREDIQAEFGDEFLARAELTRALGLALSAPEPTGAMTDEEIKEIGR